MSIKNVFQWIKGLFVKPKAVSKKPCYLSELEDPEFLKLLNEIYRPKFDTKDKK